MAVESLSPIKLTQAIEQLIRTPAFDTMNHHLSPAQKASLLASPPTWPTCPVFSPYRTTHGYYSQE
jgi:hypothetical protein